MLGWNRPDLRMLTAGASRRLPSAARLSEPKRNVLVGHGTVRRCSDHDSKQPVMLHELAALECVHFLEP